MSLLLLFGGAPSGAVVVTPIAHGNVCALLIPDEVAAGVQFTVYMEVADSSGPVALDSAAQYVVYGYSAAGVRSEAQPLAYMTQVGSANLWAGTWTPTTPGVYEIKVIGLVAATAFFAVAPVTVRPKFDPIGLAIDDVFVSRMDDDELLGTL